MSERGRPARPLPDEASSSVAARRRLVAGLTVLGLAVGTTLVVAWAVASLAPTGTTDAGTHGWPVEEVRLGGQTLVLVQAIDTSLGLAGVDSLGGLDGMLFAYPEPQDPGTRQFHMTDVRFPLDALFFDADGRLTETITMPVCELTPCPRYAPAGSFSWVVEVPAGRLDVAAGTLLEVE